ncbi:MAG: tetratricopeptide repeat protein, partial [Planctomycetota bacterium]
GTKYGTSNSGTRGRGSRGFVPTFKPTFVDTFKPTYINTFKPSSVGSRRKYAFGGKHSAYTGRRHSFAHSYSSFFRPIVSPDYRHTVCYRKGRHYTFSHIYPYYHRKHVFVCLGGYWPAHYRYIRYYRYGYYPYAWYGYYPQVYEVKGDTYNYYMYEGQDDLSQIDEETIAEAKERLPAQTYREPVPESRADKFFEDGIKAFEAGNYGKAVYYFRSATRVEPDDIVLPFAYAQALFAGKQYDEAARVLREEIVNLSEEDKAVFYPRGLYPNDETLFGQIERLAARTARYPDNEELRFLLGYQYLGIGRYEEAGEQLRRLNSQSRNSAAAAMLLELIEKITTEKEDS